MLVWTVIGRAEIAIGLRPQRLAGQYVNAISKQYVQ